MSDRYWVGILVALLGGGAMGAIIKIIFDYKQGRIQTIGKRLRVFPLFRSRENYQGLSVVVSVTHNDSKTEYRNLFVADLTVTNRTNKDYGEFEFGVALGEDKCIYAAWEDPDQHHTLSLIEPVSPSSPKSSLKLCAKPFNRADSYSLRLYLTSGRKGQQPDTPQLTSSHSIRFIDETTQSARLGVTARAISLLTIVVIILNFITFFNVGRTWGHLTESKRPWVGKISFSHRPPFPDSFDRVVPGMKLSEARAAFPRGQMNSTLYIVEIESGPFSDVAFGFWPTGEDPLIERVVLSFRDDSSRQSVLQAVLGSFGGAPHQSEVLGTRLLWNNINGYELTLDQMYAITRAQPTTKNGRAHK